MIVWRRTAQAINVLTERDPQWARYRWTIDVRPEMREYYAMVDGPTYVVEAHLARTRVESA